jgi:hypothetical protein
VHEHVWLTIYGGMQACLLLLVCRGAPYCFAMGYDNPAARCTSKDGAL